MALPTKPSHPLRPMGVIAIVAGVLILVLVAVIWQATQSLFNLPPSPMMQWAGRGTESGSVAGYPVMMGEVSDAVMPSKGMMYPAPMPPSGATPVDRARVGERVVRNGSLTMRVDDASKRLAELRVIVESAGGFIESANLTDNANVKTAYATVRVPNEKFQDVVRQAKGLASTVFDESENAEDVTAQYVDMEARLKAAKAEEQQYLEILKRAGSIEDTLNVTSRLADVRTRIEQIEGQMRYLNDRTTYATLSVTLTEEAKVEAPSRVWKPGETLNIALRGLVESLQALADFLITAGVFLVGFMLPILLGITLLMWIVRAIWKKFRRS